ncbi:MAG: hypothetical protein DRJ55_04740 [Thermoprotei archaeon]|nr:MAG: hypothetical protein DRJ55_04740 [Thermoprotei archaeon]
MGIMIKITKSDFKILKAVPKSLNYSEISRITGFSQPYVSNKIKKLLRKFSFSFRVDLHSLNIIPITIFVKDKEQIKDSNFIYKTYAVTLSTGKYIAVDMYVPKNMLEDVTQKFQHEEVQIIPKRYEVYWRPDINNLIHHEKGRILFSFNLREKYYGLTGYREGERRSFVADPIDILIIWSKMQNPFVPLASIAKKVGLSQQLVSYHYRHHVIGQWMYNGVIARYLQDENLTLLVKISTISSVSALKMLELFQRIPFFLESFIPYNNRKSIYSWLVAPHGITKRLINSLHEIEEVDRIEILGIRDSSTEKIINFPWRDVGEFRSLIKAGKK